MREWTIGDVARQAGLSASALRYYEKAGLLPKARRASGQRRYDSSVLGRLKLIQIARGAGFTIAETHRFISGFPDGTRPSARWTALAARKREELDALIAGASRMKALLDEHFRCGCPSLAACETRFAAGRC